MSYKKEIIWRKEGFLGLISNDKNDNEFYFKDDELYISSGDENYFIKEYKNIKKEVKENMLIDLNTELEYRSVKKIDVDKIYDTALKDVEHEVKQEEFDF